MYYVREAEVLESDGNPLKTLFFPLCWVAQTNGTHVNPKGSALTTDTNPRTKSSMTQAYQEEKLGKPSTIRDQTSRNFSDRA